MVQDRVPEDEIERPVLERQVLRRARRGLDLQAHAGGVGLQHVDHPLRDVGGDGAAHDAGGEQVQREVAGAGADLQRPRERAGRRSQQLVDLAEHLRAPDLAVVDAPLAVVARRRGVVIADVDVVDLLRLAAHRPASSVDARSRAAELLRQRARLELPPPRPGRGARHVHPRLRPEPQDVLQLHHRQLAAGDAWASRMSDHHGSSASTPARTNASVRACARRVGQGLPPAARRVVVVRAGVDDAVLLVVVGWCVELGSSKPNWSTTMPGKPSDRAQALDGLGDDAEVLGDDVELAELALRSAEQRAPPALGPSGRRRRRALPPAPPSRRRTRGSGRSASCRPSRTCAAAARPTTGSGGGATRASRRPGCPRAGPSRCRRRAARPACSPGRNSSGHVRWSAPPGAT